MSAAIAFWKPSRVYEKYKDEILPAITGCLERGELVLGYGEEIKKFEDSFAEFVGAKHAIMVGGGTHALACAYIAAGIGPGDEVITVSHTFIATIDQIVLRGATPVLVDIGEDGLMDPDELVRAITPRTKLIVPVHLEGKVCDMKRILEIAELHSIPVIEDSAQAIGAKYMGKGAGTFGQMGCFSCFPAKVLGCFGNAGVVVTDDDSLAKKLRLIRCNYNIGKLPIDEEASFGGNYEPDAIHAATLNVLIKYLPERLVRRRAIAERYDRAFGDTGLSLPLLQEGRVYQDYVVRVMDAFEKKRFLEHLAAHDVKYLGADLIPNHKYPGLKLDFNLPKTEEYLEKQVRLPCNPDLTDEEVQKVIDTVTSFYA